MSQPTPRKYPAEFKERAVKLAVASEQPIAQTARDLGVNENTLHTWIGKYHRAERQEQQVQDEHLYEELKRLRKEKFSITSPPLPKSAFGKSPVVSVQRICLRRNSAMRGRERKMISR